jgi:hypothetical protein
MSNIRIMNLNYADADTIVSQTYSSQQSIAPAENVLARTRRTKTWRSNGYWNVTASNNVIKFREAALGSILTATIAVAEYTSDTTFRAAVVTALQAAGIRTYTVTRNTTSNKIVITATSGAHLELLWTNAGSTAATILGFDTAVDDTGSLTYTADTLKIHTSEFLRWDLGTASLVQAFVLIGKRNEGIQITSTATITLQGNETDVWTSPSYSQVLTWNEDAIIAFDADGLHPTGLRYWRLMIDDSSNPDGYIEISNIYLGELYEPSQGSVQFPFASEYQDFSRTEFSDDGIAFSDIRQSGQTFNLRWFGLTKTEIEELEDFIKTYRSSYPFFISLDPDAVFSSSANRWVRYCRFTSNPNFQLDSPNVFSADWKLREEL